MLDRNPRNPNLLMWHHSLYLIDHGAALYFHHDWATAEEKVESPFAAIQQHVLLAVGERDCRRVGVGHQRLTPRRAARNSRAGPRCLDRFRLHDCGGTGAHSTLPYLIHRLAAAVNFEQEAIRAHQNFV